MSGVFLKWQSLSPGNSGLGVGTGSTDVYAGGSGPVGVLAQQWSQTDTQVSALDVAAVATTLLHLRSLCTKWGHAMKTLLLLEGRGEVSQPASSLMDVLRLWCRPHSRHLPPIPAVT